jgi:UDP-N-acetyl-D-mannosaminuronic acid dehydrogenase
MTNRKNNNVGKKTNKRILIIGLGQIGYSNAEYMSMKGLDVDGYDIDEKAIQRAIKDGVIRNKAKDFSGYDYLVICISTHNPTNMFIPYQDGLMSISKRIAQEGKSGALIAIDSTISRGTANKVLDIVEHRLHVCHVPHRFYIHDKEEHGVRQTRVAGACDSCCMERTRHFYHDILDIPLFDVSNIEIAELCKIVENSYRFLEIAFAEELRMLCDNSNINFQELRNAVNTKWNIKIKEARDGIGGHCLPKDSEMFLNTSYEFVGSSIIEAAKSIDKKYREHINPEILGKAVKIKPLL